MSIGWIKLHRKLLDWEWYNDANTMRLFIHLLLTVNYEPKKWQGMTINPGQRVVGREKLAKELGVSEQSLRTSLTKLKSTNNLTIKSTNKFSVITIEKWEEYQVKDDEANQQTNQQPTIPVTTTKEDKKKEKIYKIDFFLDDDARDRARKEAPQWDLQCLIQTYDEWIADKAKPVFPKDAFVRWCKSYTKGKPPA